MIKGTQWTSSIELICGNNWKDNHMSMDFNDDDNNSHKWPLLKIHWMALPPSLDSILWSVNEFSRVFLNIVLCTLLLHESRIMMKVRWWCTSSRSRWILFMRKKVMITCARCPFATQRRRGGRVSVSSVSHSATRSKLRTPLMFSGLLTISPSSGGGGGWLFLSHSLFLYTFYFYFPRCCYFVPGQQLLHRQRVSSTMLQSVHPSDSCCNAMTCMMW